MHIATKVTLFPSITYAFKTNIDTATISFSSPPPSTCTPNFQGPRKLFLAVSGGWQPVGRRCARSFPLCVWDQYLGMTLYSHRSLFVERPYDGLTCTVSSTHTTTLPPTHSTHRHQLHPAAIKAYKMLDFLKTPLISLLKVIKKWYVHYYRYFILIVYNLLL